MTQRLLLLLLAATFLAAPAQASAAGFQLSIMQDDDQLLYRDDSTRSFTVKRMRDLGVDYARVTVLWSVAAENAKFDRRGKKRKNFDASNPRTYPKGNWDRYDRLVQTGKALNVGMYLNVTGPGPAWAHAKAPKKEARNQATWKPKPREFFKFMKAVATRYNGRYRDENDGKAILPKVSFWSVYNEPNQAGWLTPQFERGIATSPVIYRDLWRYGRAALDQTGHKDDIVLIGETAPLGSNAKNARSPMHPKRFIRELFCLNAKGRRYTGSAAKKRKCSTLKKLGGSFNALAWGHHPYTKLLSPTQRDKSRDSLTMANISELTDLLDQVAARSGVGAPRNSMMTEFGYETEPDPFVGISLAKQAEYINVGEYQAWQNPRVLGQAQFLLRDVPPVKGAKRNSKQYWFTYQSGLYKANGLPKPAVVAYKMPLVVTGRGTDSVGATTVTFWGGVRFLPFGTKSQVYLQYRAKDATSYQLVGGAHPVEATGYYTAAAAQPNPGTWRAVWVNPVTGGFEFSREVEVR
jgi:hypothetical protein